MAKNYYFLAGLHRSGNTLLSLILNQNPEIYSSPLGPVCDYLWNSHKVRSGSPLSLANNYDYRSIKFISGIMDNYYYDVPQNIIIDTDKSWANPDNIQVIKTYITNNPKIIFTTRPILEIMASYIAIDKRNLLRHMNNTDFVQNSELSNNDNIADFIASEYSFIGSLIRCFFASIDNPDTKDFIHIVKYEDLLNTPQDIMNGIYDFLEISRFDHNFSNIENAYEYNEDAAFLPKDLHKVRPILERSSIKVEDYLSPHIIEKYKDFRYF